MNPNSILAILAEIKANPLGYLLEADEKREALEIIERMERKLSKPKEATNADGSNQ